MGFWCFMLAMDLIIPLSMIFLGKYFSKRAPKEINMLFGYRTARSMKNQDTWQFAHRYFGKLWYKMGLWLLILSVAAMLPGLGKDKDAVGTLGGILCVGGDVGIDPYGKVESLRKKQHPVRMLLRFLQLRTAAPWQRHVLLSPRRECYAHGRQFPLSSCGR